MMKDWERLLTKPLKAKLEANWNEQLPLKGTSKEKDYQPVVKLFSPYRNCTWLLSEKEPESSICFGLCDLGLGLPELGSVSLEEIGSMRMGKSRVWFVERDRYWTANKTLSEYASEAREAGAIIA